MWNEIVANDQKMKIKIFVGLGVLLRIFFVLTIIFAVLYGVERNKTKGLITKADDLCLTPYCIKAANDLIESIDETVDPCQNFFEFTCGTWLKKHRIPDDAGSHDTINLLRNQLDNNLVDILTSPLSNDTINIQSIINARHLYDSCVDETAIELADARQILSFINNEFGGWPILQGASWNNSSFNLSNLLFKLREYNNDIIYDCGTSIDDKNSSVYYIQISQSDLGLEQRSNYLNEPITSAYRKFMLDLARSLTNDTSMIDQDVNDIFNFENNISKFHYTPAEQRDRINEIIRTPLSNLPNVFNPHFDFTNYLRRIYSLSNITLNDNDIVSISDIHFLTNASEILNKTSARTIQNYVLWRFMMNRVTNMPKKYRMIRDPFEKALRGTTTESPRSIVCANFVNANMGFAVSKVYIKKYFDENAKNESLTMINNIRNAFIDMIKTSTWMDESSKSKAIDKALAIDEKIGYPDYLGSTNTSQLENMYREYVLNTSYISNILKLLQIKSKENLRMLRQTVDRKGWGSSPPTIVNAFYAASRNQISFPAGILQMPFFNKDAPKYLNYGGIGTVIGHEITHGFDDSGRQFDKDGNRLLWWTNETIDRFIQRKTCIVDQYSNYIIAQINRSLNGDQTQGENIADNGGIRESFYAYQTWARMNRNIDKKLPGLTQYTPEQMFFINYGQILCSKMTDANAANRLATGVHSPGQFRVIGPTSNFDEFDRVFGCKPGQGNSRIDKCTVW